MDDGKRSEKNGYHDKNIELAREVEKARERMFKALCCLKEPEWMETNILVANPEDLKSLLAKKNNKLADIKVKAASSDAYWHRLRQNWKEVAKSLASERNETTIPGNDRLKAAARFLDEAKTKYDEFVQRLPGANDNEDKIKELLCKIGVDLRCIPFSPENIFNWEKEAEGACSSTRNTLRKHAEEMGIPKNHLLELKKDGIDKLLEQNRNEEWAKKLAEHPDKITEIRGIWLRLKLAGEACAAQAANNEAWNLIKNNKKLIARECEKKGISEQTDDVLISLNLYRCALLFEWRRGYKFSTYATWWITRAINKALEERQTIKLPDAIQKNILKIDEETQKLRQEYGREPTEKELAAATNLDIEKVREALQAKWKTSTTSLEAPTGDEEEHQVWEETIGNPASSSFDADRRIESLDKIREAYAKNPADFIGKVQKLFLARNEYDNGNMKQSLADAEYDATPALKENLNAALASVKETLNAIQEAAGNSGLFSKREEKDGQPSCYCYDEKKIDIASPLLLPFMTLDVVLQGEGSRPPLDAPPLNNLLAALGKLARESKGREAGDGQAGGKPS